MLLEQSPFHVLRASTRSDRQTIMALVEEQSLSQDPDVCSRCGNELISLRTRLHCEIAWLPGVPTEHVERVIDALAGGGDPEALPSKLAHLNVTVSQTVRRVAPTPKRLALGLLEISRQCERLDVEEIRTLINDDRRIARFALIDDVKEIERALTEHTRTITEELLRILRDCPLDDWVDVLTVALDEDTATGRTPGSYLLHVLADELTVDLQSALETEKEKVDAAVALARINANAKNRPALERAMAILESTLTDWDRYAQPLQISAKSRGKQHEPSTAMAKEVRSLALTLYNDHNAHACAEHITELLARIFAEDPRILEFVANDRQQLAEQRRNVILHDGFIEELEPVTSPPSLRTFNTIGTALYGHRDEDVRTNTYVATVYFVILFVPLFPLSSYRVRKAEKGGWYFLGKVPLSIHAKRHRAFAVLAAVALTVLYLMSQSQQPATYRYGASPLAQPANQTSSASYVPQSYAPTTTSGSSEDFSGAAVTTPRSELGDWLEAERPRIRALEMTLSTEQDRVRSLEESVEEDKRSADTYEAMAVDGSIPSDVYPEYQVAVNRYNSDVEDYNDALREFKIGYAAYQVRLQAFNDSVARYNAAP